MRPIWYLLDEVGNPYPTDDVAAVNQLITDVEKRRVGLLEKEVAGHDLMVSTVFLVMDHDHFTGVPVLYETMVFIDNEEISGATSRYCTKEEAIAGHHRTVELIKQALMQLGQQNIDRLTITGLLPERTGDVS